MDAQKILRADVLDIIFENRNKEYGAYDLRKSYDKRFGVAITVTASLITLLILIHILTQNSRSPKKDTYIPKIVALNPAPHREDEPLPQSIAPKPPKIETIKHVVPRIVRDEKVAEEDRPPIVEDIDGARIGTVTEQGVKTDDIVAPPLDDNKGIIEVPQKSKDEVDRFERVEIESQYPGGPAAWQRYLQKSLNYPENAKESGIAGTVFVQFIVDSSGPVSKVQAVSGPMELRGEAVRVVSRSGKWSPAVQNGRYVKSYKKQAIVFRLE